MIAPSFGDWVELGKNVEYCPKHLDSAALNEYGHYMARVHGIDTEKPGADLEIAVAVLSKAIDRFIESKNNPQRDAT